MNRVGAETGTRNAIALVVDINMVPPAAFLATELARLNPRRDTDIFVFCDSDSAANALRSADPPCRVAVLRPDLPGVGDLPRNDQIPSGVSYARLLLPQALGPAYRRSLYLDTDLKLADPRLFDLLDLDMGGKAVAAVRDPVVSFSRSAKMRAYRERLGVGDAYFNDGVLLLDNAVFAGELAGVLAIITAHRDGLSHLEQTALNIAFRSRWLELSPSWNLFAEFEATAVGRAYPPRIVHFVGSAKPWRELKFFTDIAYQARLLDFLAASPWPDYFARQRRARDVRRFFFMRPLLHYHLDGSRRLIAPLFRRYARRSKIDQAAYRAHLRRADFADVDAGLVRPNIDWLGSA